MLDRVLKAGVAPGEPVLAPADAEALTRAARLAESVPLPVDVWEALRRTASDLGST